MAKKIVIVILLTVSLSVAMPFISSALNPMSKTMIDTTDKPLKRSTEELYQDIFVTLLDPCIQKAVDDYYLKYFKGSPTVAPYSVGVLSAERPNGYRTFLFIIKLQVKPYFGPHLTVGVDNITIRVEAGGKAQVLKFEHIKSFELPPNYQGVVKKWPPGE